MLILLLTVAGCDKPGGASEIKQPGIFTQSGGYLVEIRAHFNIMVEKVNDSVRLVAEVNVHHSTVLDDHETRLQKIEKCFE